MKVVSVVFFAVALIGSWYLVNAPKPVAEAVHAGIQNDLKRVISEYVAKKLPEAQNLRFEKMWTETLGKDRVKAHFVYSFDEKDENGAPAAIEISGAATLKKVDENGDNSTWDMEELRIQDTAVNFNEAIQITAGSDLEKSAPAAPPAETSEPKSPEHK